MPIITTPLPTHHLTGHLHLLIHRLFDGPIDVRSGGLEQAHQGHVGLIDVAKRDRQADGHAIFHRGLGKLLDHEVGRDREVTAKPQLWRGLPACLHLAWSQRDPQTVVLSFE